MEVGRGTNDAIVHSAGNYFGGEYSRPGILNELHGILSVVVFSLLRFVEALQPFKP